jgi:hypothetical protein
MIIWSDPAVQASVIATAGTVFATIVATICAAVIGKRIANGEKLKENLDVAINDIAFLLAVEDEHCKVHKENTNQSSKLRIRQFAVERGHTWSGKFTPGRAKTYL